jgi:MerR HTH family regulatory protein
MLPEAQQKGAKTKKKSGPMRQLSTRRLAEKFDVSMRTIDRWIERGIIPPGKRIRGRRFWPDDTEPKYDAAEA